MIQDVPNPEPSSAPPIPPRNPLRPRLPFNKSHQVLNKLSNDSSDLGHPTSLKILDEIDRELKNMQQWLAKATCEGNEARLGWQSNTMSQSRQQVAKARKEDECTAMEFLKREGAFDASTRYEFGSKTRGWSEESSTSSMFINRNEDEGAAIAYTRSENTAIWQVGVGVRASNADMTISSYNNGLSSPSCYSVVLESMTELDVENGDSNDKSAMAMITDNDDYPQLLRKSVEEEDARAERWLARGIPSPSPWTKKHSCNRECAPAFTPFINSTHPMSPMNNGRDVYGNHIASNKRDYFMSQSPPTPPAKDIFTKREHIQRERKQSPLSCLRKDRKGTWFQSQSPNDRIGVNVSSEERGHTQLLENTAQNTRRVDESGVQKPLEGRVVPSSAQSDTAHTPATSSMTDGSTVLMPSSISDSTLDEILDSIFTKHFGIPISPTTHSPEVGTKHHNLYDGQNVSTEGQPYPLPSGEDFLPELISPLQLRPRERGNQPLDLQPERMLMTRGSCNFGARETKRWGSAVPTAPPKIRAPTLPELINQLHSVQEEDEENNSVSSHHTELELESFGLSHMERYVKADYPSEEYETLRKQKREGVQFQTQEEPFQPLLGGSKQEDQLLQPQERGTHLASLQHAQVLNEREHSQGSTIETANSNAQSLTPSDSISQRLPWWSLQSLPPRKEMHAVHENENLQFTRNDWPRHNVNEQIVNQDSQPGPAPKIVSGPVMDSAIKPAGFEKKTMKSLEMGLHVAGKVARFLRAAPSDSKLKSYSRRLLPDEQQRDSRTNSNRGIGKRKGKEKAVDTRATSARRTFVSNLNHQPKYNASTLQNGKTHYKDSIIHAGARPSSPQSHEVIHTNKPPTPSASDDSTLWPVQDEHGNIQILRGRAHMRGGRGGEHVLSRFSRDSSVDDKAQLQTKESAWTNREYALALRSLE